MIVIVPHCPPQRGGGGIVWVIVIFCHSPLQGRSIVWVIVIVPHSPPHVVYCPHTLDFDLSIFKIFFISGKKAKNLCSNILEEKEFAYYAHYAHYAHYARQHLC